MIEQTLMDVAVVNAAIINGDKDAWDTVYHAYFSRLCQFVLTRPPFTISEEDAKQVVHDAFCKVVRTSAKRPFQHVKEFDGWILTVTKNCLRDYTQSKAQKAQSIIEVRQDLGLLDVEVPEDTAVEPPSMPVVSAALERLQDRDRKIVLMRSAGMQPTAIAEELGMPANAVRTYYGRAVQKLKKALGLVEKEPRR